MDGSRRLLAGAVLKIGEDRTSFRLRIIDEDCTIMYRTFFQTTVVGGMNKVLTGQLSTVIGLVDKRELYGYNNRTRQSFIIKNKRLRQHRGVGPPAPEVARTINCTYNFTGKCRTHDTEVIRIF
jgi:hypothetical protein